MTKFLTSSFVLLFLTFSSLKAQQDLLYGQYFWNKIIANPAFTGSENAIAANIIAREQWIGIDGGPSTQSFSIQSPLKNEAIALGIDVVHDKIGPSETTLLNANIAFRIKVSETSKLAFGLKTGLDLWKADIAGIGEQNDPFFERNVGAKTKPNFGVGVYLHGEKHYLGLSSGHLFQSANESATGIVQRQDPAQNVYFMAGYSFEISSDLEFKPNFLYRIQMNEFNSFELMTNLVFKEKFGLGMSLRDSRSMGVNTSYRLLEKMNLIYAFDFQTGAVQGFNSGAHQIAISYNFQHKIKEDSEPRFY
ncbi:MAG: type IX secretion system membrane protein PorP/SprF [Bacteroidota bacterium]